MRTLAPKTQTAYIRAVRKFAKFLGHSPDTATDEDLRRFQLDMVDKGTSPITLNATIVALNFLFTVTLGRPEAMAKIPSVRVPRKLPVVLNKDEVTRLLGCVSHIKHQTALSSSAGVKWANIIFHNGHGQQKVIVFLDLISVTLDVWRALGQVSSGFFGIISLWEIIFGEIGS